MNPFTPETKFVPKAWGSELWVCNNEEFCGKVLRINKGKRFSMHFHRDKREVFFVREGALILSFIDTNGAQFGTQALKAGDVVEIPRLAPHQLEAVEDSEVIEFSTHHEDSDSYRVLPGDSQARNP